MANIVKEPNVPSKMADSSENQPKNVGLNTTEPSSFSMVISTFFVYNFK